MLYSLHFSHHFTISIKLSILLLVDVYDKLGSTGAFDMLNVLLLAAPRRILSAGALRSHHPWLHSFLNATGLKYLLPSAWQSARKYGTEHKVACIQKPPEERVQKSLS